MTSVIELQASCRTIKDGHAPRGPRVTGVTEEMSVSTKYKHIAEMLGGVPVDVAKEAATAIAQLYPQMELHQLPPKMFRWIATGQQEEGCTPCFPTPDDRAEVAALLSHFAGMNGRQRALMLDVASSMGPRRDQPTMRPPFLRSSWTEPGALDTTQAADLDEGGTPRPHGWRDN
jgi:hypothetical protein